MPMERAEPCGGCLSAYGSPAGSYEAGQQHYARSKNRIMPTMEIPGEMIRKAVMPDRLVMLDVLKSTIFPICKTIETVRVTDDQMDLECTLERGTILKSLIKEIEEDGAVRYVTASLEETEDEDLLDISKRQKIKWSGHR